MFTGCTHNVNVCVHSKHIVLYNNKNNTSCQLVRLKDGFFILAWILPTMHKCVFTKHKHILLWVLSKLLYYTKKKKKNSNKIFSCSSYNASHMLFFYTFMVNILFVNKGSSRLVFVLKTLRNNWVCICRMGIHFKCCVFYSGENYEKMMTKLNERKLVTRIVFYFNFSNIHCCIQPNVLIYTNNMLVVYRHLPFSYTACRIGDIHKLHHVIFQDFWPPAPLYELLTNTRPLSSF